MTFCRILLLPFVLLPASALAQAESWTVLPESRIDLTYVGNPMRGGGSFEQVSGIVRFDPDAPEAFTADIEIDVTSLQLRDVLATKLAQEAAWFDGDTYPLAHFQADGAVATDDGFSTEGMLTIKELSLPIPVHFVVTVDGDTAFAAGETSVSRSAFELGTSDQEVDQALQDRVSVTINVFANRPVPAP